QGHLGALPRHPGQHVGVGLDQFPEAQAVDMPQFDKGVFVLGLDNQVVPHHLVAGEAEGQRLERKRHAEEGAEQGDGKCAHRVADQGWSDQKVANNSKPAKKVCTFSSCRGVSQDFVTQFAEFTLALRCRGLMVPIMALATPGWANSRVKVRPTGSPPSVARWPLA